MERQSNPNVQELIARAYKKLEEVKYFDLVSEFKFQQINHESSSQDQNTGTMEGYVERDKRYNIDSNDYPQSAIGLITYQNDSGQPGQGTFFLVGQRYGLTAAHCIYDLETKKGQFKNIKFQFRNKEVFEVVRHKRIKYDENIKNAAQESQRKNIDYALIQFEEDVGKKYGFFNLDFSGQLKGQQQYELCGFPGIVYKDDIAKNADKKMYGHKGQCQKGIGQHQGRIKHWIDSSKGQSGGPIFQKRGDKYYVVGIHTDGPKLIKQGQFNSGVLLNNQRKNKLNKWIDKKICKLALNFAKLTDQDLEKILNSERIDTRDIKTLQLRSNNLTTNIIKKLLQKQWTQLVTIDLQQNYIGKQGAKLLLQHKWDKIQLIDLSKNHVYLLGKKANDQNIDDGFKVWARIQRMKKSFKQPMMKYQLII